MVMGDDSGAAGNTMVETLPPSSVNATKTPLVTELPATEAPSGINAHPIIGYLICIIVLATFGTAIGFICVRHYKRRQGARMKLPDDEEEGPLTFKDGPDDTSKDTEKIKTVVLKRNNGKEKASAKDNSDEATPMISSMKEEESQSDAVAVELTKFTKKTDDLPMIDEREEMARSAERLTDEQPAQQPSPSAVAADTTKRDSTDSTEAHMREQPPPSNERETLTESQVLEILDDAPEEPESPSIDDATSPLIQQNGLEENDPSETTTADVHDLHPPQADTTKPTLPSSELSNTDSANFNTSTDSENERLRTDENSHLGGEKGDTSGGRLDGFSVDNSNGINSNGLVSDSEQLGDLNVRL